MSYVAAFDIGTTAVKGVLISEDGKYAAEKSLTLETLFYESYREQKPGDWYSAFCSISRDFFKEGLSPSQIIGIVMSGQMQDLIPVDRCLRPVCNAILYSDGRAEAQAEEICNRIGRDRIEQSTGNHFDGSMPFAKLLWLKQNRRSEYAAAERVLISSKDYIIARLTGNYVTDVTSASTAGLLDIRSKSWNAAWMEDTGLDPGKLPPVLYAEEQAGLISAAASEESGFAQGTPVYAGTGDAGATTLASGIALDGEFNVNLGTSGWIAGVSGDVLGKPQVFNLAAMQRDLYINVVPFLNAGNVHSWISGILFPGLEQTEKYRQFDQLLERSKAGSNGIRFLPYLVGERFPVMDTSIRGGYAGIGTETTREDLARSALEGVAFSIRQGLDSIGKAPKKISLIGGGARSKGWCQILADVLNYPVFIYGEAEYLPSAATAAAALIAQGRISGYGAFVDSLLEMGESTCYLPDLKASELYNKIYEEYLKIYPALKTI